MSKKPEKARKLYANGIEKRRQEISVYIPRG